MFITAFYQFIALDEAGQDRLTSALEATARAVDLRGLCLVGPEGINLTASGPTEAIAALKATLGERLGADPARFKDARAERHPFRHFKVKRRPEIVTLGKPELKPAGRHRHVSPREWHAMLDDPEAIVLDTRNDYEVAMGKFRRAVDFDTREFRDFPEKLKAAALPKDKPVLIYCTGGIRCEKAILELEDQGFGDVRQLDGGILNYLKEYPDEKFDGECFVFDYRVAVDQNLQPTTAYKLCPHCGQPAKDVVTCVQCGDEAPVCQKCSAENATCSKNCAHHFAIKSRSTRTHRAERTKRHWVGDAPGT